MFNRLINYSHKSYRDAFCGSLRISVNRRTLNNRVNKAYESNDFRCMQKALNCTYAHVNYEKESSQGWQVLNWNLVVLGLLSYFWVKDSCISTEEKDEEEYETGIPRIVDNLPCDTPYYTEMKDKREALEKGLEADQVVVISGIGGMGKSTLAIEYGRDCKKKGDQVLYLNGSQIEEEFFKLAKHLGIEIRDQKPDMIRDLIYGDLNKLSNEQAIILIFDNVDDKVKIEEYLRWIPRSLKIIITSRDQHLLEGKKVIELQGFNNFEAMSYVKTALGKSEETVKKLVEAVSESPFRLSKAIAYLKNHNLTSIEEYIRKYKFIKAGREIDKQIYPEVELLFGDLKNESKQGWQIIKYLAYLDLDGVSLEFIRDIIGAKNKELEISIQFLNKLSLIEIYDREDKTKIKLSHKIVQEELVKTLIEEDKNQVQELLKTLINKINILFPIVNDKNPEEWEEAIEWLKHGEKLIAEIDTDVFLGEEDLLIKIGAFYYSVCFDYHQAINYYNRVLYLSNDTEQKVFILNSICSAYVKLEDEENIYKGLSYSEEALKMARELSSDNNGNVLLCLNNIGLAYMALGGEENILKGLSYYEEALKIKRELFTDNYLDLSVLLNNISLAYIGLEGEENIRKGLSYLEEGLKISRDFFFGNEVDTTLFLNNIGVIYINLGGEENIRKGLSYYEEALEIERELFSDNHPNIVLALNNMGLAYSRLEGEENIRKGLVYYEEGLKMTRELFSDNHPEVARILNNIGLAYMKLGGNENFCKGLEYCEKALKIQRELFSDNHLDVAYSLSNVGNGYYNLEDKENIYKGLRYCKEALKIGRALFPSNHPSIAIFLNNIGSGYSKLEGKENARKGLEYCKEALKIERELFSDNYPQMASVICNLGTMYCNLDGEEDIRTGLEYYEEALMMQRVLFPNNHPEMARILNNIGIAYLKLRQLGNAENTCRGLSHCEEALKIYQALFPDGHPSIAMYLDSIALVYLDFHDYNKALEYTKQAYAIACIVMDRDSPELKKFRHRIAFLQPNFFQKTLIEIQFKDKKDYLGGKKIGREYRWLVLSRGEVSNDLLLLKQKIQRDVLNEIGNAVKVYGWDYNSFLWINWGVKGYLDKNYLLIKLENLANDEENLETAQMLCFEAMNLGIMKSIKDRKPYEIAEIFTKENTELVKKIAIEHPEFFVDGSIVEACVRAMPDLESKEFILEHVKYIGMKERRNAGLIDVLLKRDE